MAITLVSQVYPAPDTHPELIVDDLDGKGVGQWVPQMKHLLLCKYITASRAAAKRFPHWIYIDPFSGPGRIRVKGEEFTRPGGAMVAWLQSRECGHQFSRMMIGDIDQARLHACKIRLDAQHAPVTAYHGPADETVYQMVRVIPQGALCLVYIDPYNLALLSYSMIKALAALPNVDFIVHFSTMDLLRNVDMELDPERARFDDVLPGWRNKLGANHSKANLSTRFFGEWQDQIKKLGFGFSDACPLVTNDDNRVIYRLVSFSRHAMALRIWKDIAREKNRSLFD